MVSKMNRDDLEFVAGVYKVLGHPNRLKILDLLRGGEMYQDEFIGLLGQSQSTVSRHLGLLVECGLLSSRVSDGGLVFYCVVDDRVFRLVDLWGEGLLGVVRGVLRSRLGI